jgi:hypothetical protein
MSRNLPAHALDERQQRVQRLLSSGGPATPPSLRARLARQPARPTRPAPWLGFRVALAGCVAAVSVVAVLALTLAGQAGPTLADAARPAAQPATAPAPAPDTRRSGLLRASFAGVSYPDWERQFGWRATGRRHDTLDGRTAETVFYQHTHHRIGYTVVSGEPLEPPGHAERLVVNGLEIRAYTDGPRDVITFRRNGRTCVLAGAVHRRSTLLKLASWKGEGEIVF